MKWEGMLKGEESAEAEKGSGCSMSLKLGNGGIVDSISTSLETLCLKLELFGCEGYAFDLGKITLRLLERMMTLTST